MKKLLIVLISFSCAVSAHAQSASPVALNVYGSYVFQDKIDFEGFTGYAAEGFQYGIGVEYFLDPAISVELKYLRQDTRFPLYGPAGTQLNSGKEDGSVNYILVGGNSYFGGKPSAKLVPFGGLGLGLGIVNSNAGGSATKFAWDGKLGIQIKTSSKVSVKLHASFQSIIAAVGSDFYYSPGGLVIAVPDYATLFQFGLGGGLSYRF